MARDRKQLGARVVRAAKAREPFRTAPQDRGHNSNGFDIVHRGRAPIEASPRRERRFHPRHTLAPLKAFQQCGLLTTDVSARAVVQIKIEIPTRASGILTQKPRVIAFVDRSLQSLTFANVLAANVDITRVGVHGERRDQTAFDQRVRIVAHNLAVFAGARLAFVSVDHQIRRATIAFLGHKAPLQTGGETRTTTATQT